MGASFTTTGNQNVITTDITALTVTQRSSPVRRGNLYYFEAAFAGGTPADHVQGLIAQRTTTEGTGTAVVPAPHDAAEAAATVLSDENHTAEPTYTSATELFDGSCHMRSRLVYDARKPWVIPATADNGIGIFLQSDGSRTDLWHFMAEFEE